ncbi:MetQ/NlpA family ABC transporter substrate-binding protein [Caenispirillum bisanense]|uniref:Lipoprotein n=1 Tax=Caenispirillum bisanense TaxID=414052 RepID=A0A286G4N0_9PROT|nr:MetQ/NlpA family ABC transporter substrate-binding protein [Caenispirillum bisanense]SOD90510.1 D-methionine transport system substrate-binding protein [Caenispirillum bisanense]
MPTFTALRPLAVAAVFAAATLAGPAMADTKDTVRIGVTPGSHEEVMEVVREVAKEKGLTLEIVPFTDYVLPNTALADGDLDANSFQHQPYLDQQVKDRGFDLVSVGKNFVEPMGIYSQSVKSLDALPEGAQIAIPNDPTNGGRALLLLDAQGVIGLKDDVGLTPSPLDIAENPKNLEFTEVDAAQLPRVLPDVAAAAINTNYALEAGLNPLKDAVAIEKADSPYANIIVVQGKNADAPWVKTLVEAYQTPKVREFILERFQGAVVPAF